MMYNYLIDLFCFVGLTHCCRKDTGYHEGKIQDTDDQSAYSKISRRAWDVWKFKRQIGLQAAVDTTKNKGKEGSNHMDNQNVAFL